MKLVCNWKYCLYLMSYQGKSTGGLSTGLRILGSWSVQNQREAVWRQESTRLHYEWKISYSVEIYSIHLLFKAREAEMGYWNTYEYKLYFS